MSEKNSECQLVSFLSISKDGEEIQIINERLAQGGEKLITSDK